MSDDMKELLEIADEMDCLHDINFRIGTNNIVAHRFVIYSNARRFYEHFCSSPHVAEDRDDFHHPIEITEISEEIFQLILEFIYTGSCEFFNPQSQFWKRCSSSWASCSSRNLINGEGEEEENEFSRSGLLKDLQRSAKKLKVESMERILDKVS